MKIYKTCIVRLAGYPEEARVKKQVEALLENNFKVDIVCIRFIKKRPIFERDGNIRIFRLPFRKSRSRSILKYLIFYSFSSIAMTFLITGLCLFNNYQTIQVHTLPDFLTFTTIIPKLFGIKIVTDFHEPTPELIQTKFGNKKKFLYRFAIKIEQMVLKYSNLSLTVTKSLKDRFVQRGADGSKIVIVTNAINDLDFLNARSIPKHRSEDFILITHGSIEERYGHKLIINAVNELKNECPSIKFFICGFGYYEQDLKKLTFDLGCEDQVKFLGYLPFGELLKLLRSSDVGIVSMPSNPYSELIDTNKLYEYIALGLPVIHSRLKPIEENFPNNSIKYYEPGNLESLKKAILELYNNPKESNDLIKNADLIYDKLRWQVVKNEFVKSIKYISDK